MPSIPTSRYDTALIAEHALEWIDQNPWYKDLDRDAIIHKVVEHLKAKQRRRYAFTDASLFIHEIFDTSLVKDCCLETGEDLAHARNSAPVVLDESTFSLARVLREDDKFDEAAKKLEGSDLWVAMREHVLLRPETSSRSLIDAVLLSGISLAQRLLQENEDIQNSLLERHPGLDPDPYPVGEGRTCAAWFVLNQEVKVDAQPIGEKIEVRGQLDYVIGVVAAYEGEDHPPEPMKGTNPELCASTVYHALKSKKWLTPRVVNSENTFLVGLTVAKSAMAFGAEWENQALAESVALLCATNRNAVVNILSDGQCWKFIYVVPIQIENTDLESEGGPSRLSEPRPSDKKKQKPFRYQMTNVLELGEDTRLILKLLTAALLGAPESFTTLAQVCR
ncbi:hypothetical protein MKEN_00587700 [Mycena kentingensis (nom. inval.)]|nr:hypothetical protein MKEN_00587700 [Mycena kentingensis (nom. inval.)]